MKTVGEIYQDNIDTLERNVANDLVHLFFDENASDEELKSFYKADVNRENLVNDTVQRLLDDQQMLKFLIDNKEKFIQTYGDKNALSDFGRTVQRADARGTEQGSINQDDGGAERGESVTSPYHETGSDDNGAGASDSGSKTGGA